MTAVPKNDSRYAQSLIDQFFDNYPDETLFDNVDEVNRRIQIMVQAVQRMREAAIEQRSIELLEKARTLDAEAGQLFLMLQQRHAQRAMKSGIQLPTDLKNWRK